MSQFYCILYLPATSDLYSFRNGCASLFDFSISFHLFNLPFIGAEILFCCMCGSVIIVMVLHGISKTNVLYRNGCGLFILVKVSEIQFTLLSCHFKIRGAQMLCCWVRLAIYQYTLCFCFSVAQGSHSCLCVSVC